jgi:hypothetical protein
MSVTDTLRSFLREVLDTPLKQELLAFFVTNRAMDTAHGLSVWLGRPADEIRAAADSLVQAGLLRKEGEGENAIYSYQPRPEIADLVDAFLHLYQTARAQLQQELLQARQQVEQAWEQLRALQWEQSRFRLILSSMTGRRDCLAPRRNCFLLERGWCSTAWFFNSKADRQKA